MANVKLPKSPLWFRIISKPLYRMGVITVWTKGTPDVKWSLTYYKVQNKTIDQVVEVIQSFLQGEQLDSTGSTESRPPDQNKTREGL